MSRRAKFFFSHLLISFFIALLFIAIVFLFWYPFPLAKAVGVTYIFLMLIAIDVVVGPILGLFVYKEGKKTLKLDLTVIILLQSLALVYGMYSIAKGRPVWIVQNENLFELVRYNDIVKDHIHEAQPQYQTPSWFKPQYVAVHSGDTVAERNKNLFEAITTGVSNAMRPELYMPLDSNKKQLAEISQELEKLNDFNNVQQVQVVLTKYPQADAWLPLRATSVDMTVLINKEKGEVVKIVDLRPWK